jgi:uncharacterized damage-inducible protein DinB
MRKLFIFLAAVFLVSFSTADNTISKSERKSAAKFLKEAEKAVLKKVKGLSEAQLKFKPAADKWSVEDCMMHIAASEKMLWGLVEKTLGEKANPEKRSEIKWTDEDVKKNIEDRTNKVKTFAPLEPLNTGYKTMDEAITSFKENRAKLITYIKTTEADLRSHVAQLPVGMFDCYQMILFVGAHSNRHMRQMEEVMADASFPK